MVCSSAYLKGFLFVQILKINVIRGKQTDDGHTRSNKICLPVFLKGMPVVLHSVTPTTNRIPKMSTFLEEFVILINIYIRLEQISV